MTTEKTTKKKRSFFRKVVKVSFGILLFLIFVVAILLYSFNAYLQSNEKKIIENVAFLNHGSISFDQAYISIFENFPFASIVLNNVEVVDSMYHMHQRPVILAQEVQAQLSLHEWRNKSFEVKEFVFVGGEFNLYKDVDGYSNLQSLLSKRDIDKKKKPPVDRKLPKININTEYVKIKLQDIAINVIDSLKTMSLLGKAESLKADVHLLEDRIECRIDMDVAVEELTFKQREGSFLRDAQVSGKLEAIVSKGSLDIKPCHLNINNQRFLFEGKIATDRSAATVLNLENQNTLLVKVLPLLPKKISKVIRPYEIDGAFYTNTQIYLKPGNPARVDVRFQLSENDLMIQGFPFQQAQLSGRFMNRRFFKEKLNAVKKGHIRLELADLKVRHEVFQLQSEKILITSNPITKASIQSSVRVSGPASAISKWYKSDKFFFEDGHFVLDAAVSGPLNNVNNLILGSTADLALNELSIFYEPSDVSIPVKSLELTKKSGDAKFSLLTSSFAKAYDYRLKGGLKNLTALLVDLAEESASSNVNLEAERLGWEDFVGVFSKRKSADAQLMKDERETKKSMKETVRGIYNKFQPSISIAIDTFEYFDIVELYNVKTGVYFESENILELEETGFDLDQGSVSIRSRLDISDPHQTKFDIELHAQNANLAEVLPAFDYFNIKLLANHPKLPDDFSLDIELVGVIDDVKGLLPNSTSGEISFRNDDIEGLITFEPDANPLSDEMETKIELEGTPYLFNKYFKTEKFIFQDTGKFYTQFIYKGDVSSFDHLLEEAKIDFAIDKGAVYYKDVDVVFPLNDFKVYLYEDTVNYKLYMYSDILDRDLKITGDIDNVSELIVGNTGKRLSTNVNVYSPILNLEHAIDIFETTPDTNEVRERYVDEKMKRLISSVFNKFNPHLQVTLDTFIISDKIQLTNLQTGAQLKDSTFFILEQTDFKFCGGTIGLNVELDVSLENEEPFVAQINTNELDLGRLLYKLDYLGINSLESAELVDGKITMGLDFVGSLVDLKLLRDKTQAVLDFNLYEFEIKGVDVIDEISRKLFVKRFFHDIRFAPIENRITINGNRIDIPQMEIQSTSINLFVEGYVDNTKKTNLWLSVPLDNLKTLNQIEVPDKRGYALTKKKIFLEMSTNDEGKTKTRFRFRKKKFYKQRGILPQFKIDKKKNRKIRRAKRKGG